MITKNRIDKSFGPSGSNAGFVLFIAGIFTAYYSNVGIFLAIAGAFMAFTYTSTHFNSASKKIRYSENLFGLFPYGKWISLEPDMKLQVHPSKKAFGILSRSNKELKIEQSDFRIVLFTSEMQEIMPVQKFKTREMAEQKISQLRSIMGFVE